MMQIKALVAAAACTLVLPAFAAETPTAKAVEKSKAEAKADAKKPAAAKEKFAGQVSTPAVTPGSVEAKGNGATNVEPYSLRNERWVPKEDRS